MKQLTNGRVTPTIVPDASEERALDYAQRTIERQQHVVKAILFLQTIMASLPHVELVISRDFVGLRYTGPRAPTVTPTQATAVGTNVHIVGSNNSVTITTNITNHQASGHR